MNMHQLSSKTFNLDAPTVHVTFVLDTHGQWMASRLQFPDLATVTLQPKAVGCTRLWHRLPGSREAKQLLHMAR